ncbi:hypothetical protein [Fibrella aquatilis]|uniref:Uncharacterized protein n=1 Tax=Fibrella aquatilis TaxID=2817059 RepID=A0A939G8P1_9BACT|nr:hypothetical protein [Fibrella aquatilis]MBO0932400.1 hypothetical protein [Fibrella aquatilis]
MQLTHNPLPLTVGGRYVDKARKGSDYLIGQIGFRLTKRLSLLGQVETMSIYSGDPLLFDNLYNIGGPGEVFTLPDYPNYYVENTTSNFTNYYSHRRSLLVGLGYDVLLRKHWYLRLAALGGINSLSPLRQSILLKEKGSNYLQAVNYIPIEKMGYAANTELMLGYSLRVGQRQEIRLSFDHALTYNQLAIDYLIQTANLTGKTSQTSTHESYSLWLRRVGFSVQYGF